MKTIGYYDEVLMEYKVDHDLSDAEANSRLEDLHMMELRYKVSNIIVTNAKGNGKVG